MRGCDFKIFFVYSLSLKFICVFPFFSTYLSTLHGWTFPWVLSGKVITWAKYITLTIFAKTPRKTDKYFSFAKSNLHENSFTHLRHFVTFPFFWFHWKITWHLGKVNSPRVLSSRVSTPPSCLPLKTTNKLFLYNLYHFMWYSKNVRS